MALVAPLTTEEDDEGAAAEEEVERRDEVEGLASTAMGWEGSCGGVGWAEREGEETKGGGGGRSNDAPSTSLGRLVSLWSGERNREHASRRTTKTPR